MPNIKHHLSHTESVRLRLLLNIRLLNIFGVPHCYRRSPRQSRNYESTAFLPTRDHVCLPQSFSFPDSVTLRIKKHLDSCRKGKAKVVHIQIVIDILDYAFQP